MKPRLLKQGATIARSRRCWFGFLSKYCEPFLPAQPVSAVHATPLHFGPRMKDQCCVLMLHNIWDVILCSKSYLALFLNLFDERISAQFCTCIFLISHSAENFSHLLLRGWHVSISYVLFYVVICMLHCSHSALTHLQVSSHGNKHALCYGGRHNL